MIRISDNAVDFLQRKRRADDKPETDGVRIYRQAAFGEGDRSKLAMAFVPEPEPEDRVVEARGMRFFIDPEADTDLDDAVIDFDEQDTAPPAPPQLHTRTG